MMRSKKLRTLGLALALPIAVLLVVLSSMQLASASTEEMGVWEQPHHFFGKLMSMTGEDAPAGLEVKAEGEGVLPSHGNPITTDQVGEYGGGRDPELTDLNLLVQGEEIAEGTPIEFYVNSRRADCREVDPDTGEYKGDWRDSYPWHYDGHTVLDLRAILEAYTLTVTAGDCCPVSVITHTTAVTVAAGDTGVFPEVGSAELEAITGTCCSFVEWTVVEESETITENPTTIDLSDYDKDLTVVATCQVPGPFSLTVNSDPEEGGTVNVDPDQPDYACGTTVTVTAVPTDTNWVFTGWLGDLTGSDNPDIITMDSDKVITATFSQLEYTLEVTSTGCYSISVAYDTVTATVAADESDSFAVPGGAQVTLETLPAACCSLDRWEVDGVSQGNPESITVLMDSDHTVEAISHGPPFSLTVNRDPEEGGTVSVDPDQPDYACGTTVTVTAVPTDTNWVFTGWLGDLTGSDNPDIITMDSDKVITATFEPAEYPLTVTSDGCCSISVAYDTVTDTVAAGATEVFTITNGVDVSLEAIEGDVCSFDGWAVDGTAVAGNPNPITVTMDGPHTAVATCSTYRLFLPIIAKNF